MRIATLAIVCAALASGSSALAIGPPRPPQPPPGPPQPLPASGTGLIGYVSRGPVSPVCRVGVPCFRPAQVTLRFGRRQAVAVRVSTRPTGGYRVALKPGIYTVSVAGTGRLPAPAVGRDRAGVGLEARELRPEHGDLLDAGGAGIAPGSSSSLVLRLSCPPTAGRGSCT